MTAAREFQRAFLSVEGVGPVITHPVGIHQRDSKYQRSPGVYVEVPCTSLHTTSKQAQCYYSSLKNMSREEQWSLGSKRTRWEFQKVWFNSWCFCSIISVTSLSLCASFRLWSGTEISTSYSSAPFLRQHSLKLWCVLYVLHYHEVKYFYVLRAMWSVWVQSHRLGEACRRVKILYSYLYPELRLWLLRMGFFLSLFCCIK